AQLENLCPDRIEHLCLRSLELFVGDCRAQLTFAATLPDVVDTQCVNGVRSSIRVRFIKPGETARQRRIERDLLGADRQYGVWLVAGDQARRPINFDLISRGKN